MKGVIYIFKNPSFPDYVKIGYANDVKQRLKILNDSEAVPYAFRIFATYEVEDRLTDKELHKLIDTLDPNLRSIDEFEGKKRVREFYEMSAEKAYSLLECIAKISGTTERLKKYDLSPQEADDEKQAELVKNRRKVWKFSQYGLSVGDRLEFIKDSSMDIVIEDERHVRCNGEIKTLSGISDAYFGYSTAGPNFFTYNGKLLSEIRSELESE
ncbi:MAG: GIY-YIG nuclease family protein [Lachnospiraceae bacterium]|nr:GIY-YIG nuclease family protein [Lachnospiraceae bacterium]